jgi:hypothetical protein
MASLSASDTPTSRRTSSRLWVSGPRRAAASVPEPYRKAHGSPSWVTGSGCSAGEATPTSSAAPSISTGRFTRSWASRPRASPTLRRPCCGWQRRTTCRWPRPSGPASRRCATPGSIG